MKTLRIAVLALFLPMLVLAQDKKDMKEKSKMRAEKTASTQTDWMKMNLNLTSDQMEDVEEINHKYVEKREEIFMEDGSKEDKWKDIEENWNEQFSELQSVLDEDQYAKLESEKQKWYDDTKARWDEDMMDHKMKDDDMMEASDDDDGNY